MVLCGCLGSVEIPPPHAVEIDVDAGAQIETDAGAPIIDAGATVADAGTPIVDAGIFVDAGVATHDAGIVTGCSFPQGVPEDDFIGRSQQDTDTDRAVDDAVDAAMQALTGCDPRSYCPLSAFPGATVVDQCQSWFAAVTENLRARGLCAGQHELGSTDEIAVSNTGCTGRWYGYHICNYGGPLAVWNPGARRGWWTIVPSHCP
jgi:hypothetical protein